MAEPNDEPMTPRSDVPEETDPADPRYHARIVVIFSAFFLVLIAVFVPDSERTSFLIATVAAASLGALVSLVFRRSLNRALTTKVGQRGRILVLLAVPLVVAFSRDAPPAFYGAVLGFIVVTAVVTVLLPPRK